MSTILLLHLLTSRAEVKMHQVFVGVMVVMATTMLNDVTGRCPATCFCQQSSWTVYCSRRGLDAVPDTVPRGTRQLHLNGNHFKSPIILRANFSRFPDVFESGEWSVERLSGLEHLYLSDCAIVKIEAGAFVDLVHLRWLDLSDNRIEFLTDGTFAGLHLHQLFLNGNRRLSLDGGSPFANLTVSGLYLHDCRLTRLDAGTLAPLRGSLRVLWLRENRLNRLDSALSDLFASLDHFRLANNRLHCNCELSWLWRLYEQRRQRMNRDLLSEEVPECVSPASLRGRRFLELSEDDLLCRAPTVADVEVSLIDDDDDNVDDGDDVGQSLGRRRLVLRCTATGDPTPDVHWIEAANRLLPPTSLMQEVVVDEGEALLVVNGIDVQSTSPESSAFTCVASNIVGNVTLTVRRVSRSWQLSADTDYNEAAPRYAVSEMSSVDERRLPIKRKNGVISRPGKACGVLQKNRTDLSQLSSPHDLCSGGRDRRLRASSSLDQLGLQSSVASDDAPRYGLEYLVVAVVVTVLLTAASVVTAMAVYLRHSPSAIIPQHTCPTTYSSATRSASATSVRHTVAYLTSKSRS